MEELLTTKEVATTLRVSRLTVIRMIEDGRLIGVKISPTRWRIKKESVNKLLEEPGRGS